MMDMSAASDERLTPVKAEHNADANENGPFYVVSMSNHNSGHNSEQEDSMLSESTVPPVYFACEFCQETFHDREGLIEHRYSQHADRIQVVSEIVVFGCDQCPQCFESKNELREHKAYYHATPMPSQTLVFACELCSRNYRNREDLLEHKATHNMDTTNAGSETRTLAPYGFSNTAAFKCPFCEQTCDSESDMTKHLLNQHIQRNHVSDVSSLGVSDNSSGADNIPSPQLTCESLSNPSVTINAIGDDVSRSCNSVAEPSLYSTEKPESSKTWKCQTCFKEWNTYFAYDSHKKFSSCKRKSALSLSRIGAKHPLQIRIQRRNINKCHLCGKNFRNTQAMKKHLHYCAKMKNIKKSAPDLFDEKTVSLQEPLINLEAIATQQKLLAGTTADKSGLGQLPIENDFKTCQICYGKIKVRSEGKNLLSNFWRHMEQHRGNTPYRCKYCMANFTHQITCARHQLQHQLSNGNLKCLHCDELFTKKTVLRKHCQDYLLSVDISTNTVTSSPAKNYDVAVTLSPIPTAGPPPLASLDQSFSDQVEISPNKRASALSALTDKSSDLQCKECFKMLPCKSYLLRHIEIHGGDKPHYCQYCLAAFKTEVTCKRHEGTHVTATGWFTCFHCDTDYELEENLRQHCKFVRNQLFDDLPDNDNFATITELEPDAPVTTVGIYNSDAAKANSTAEEAMVTSGDDFDEVKPHQCPVCFFVAGQRCDLAKHMQVHSEETFRCSYCDAHFNREITCKKHEWKHVLENGCFRCLHCDKSFFLIANLMKHCKYIRSKREAQQQSQEKKDLVPVSLVNGNVSDHDVSMVSVDNDTSSLNDSPSKSGQTHQCMICYKVLPCRSYLRRHAEVHHGVCSYECKYCGAHYKAKNTLEKHEVQHLSDSGLFNCLHCSKQFDLLEDLQEHYTKVRSEAVIVDEDDLPQVSDLDIERHEDPAPAVSSTILKLQSNVYDQESLLAMSMELSKLEGATKNFQCPVCFKGNGQRCDLLKHCCVHADRSFHCKYCNANFTKEKTCLRHESFHMVGGSIICLHCDKEFFEVDDLKQHCESIREEIRIAAGVKAVEIKTEFDPLAVALPSSDSGKPDVASLAALEDGSDADGKDGVRKHQCPICFYVAAYNSNLRVHVQQVHNQKKFSCKLCGAYFSRELSCRNHQKLHIMSNGRYKCLHCEKQFSLKASLYKHCEIVRSTINLEDMHNDIENSDQKESTDGSGNTDTKNSAETASNSFTDSDSDSSYQAILRMNCKFSIAVDGVYKTVHQCPLCFCIVNQRCDLLKHIRKLHKGDAQHECKYCGARFNHDVGCRRHQKLHLTESGLYKCLHCQKDFQKKSSLRKHCIYVRNARALQTASVKSIEEPASPKVEVLKELKVELTNTNTASTLEEKKESQDVEKSVENDPFKCKICHKVFAWKKNISKHMKEVHKVGIVNKATIQCKFCYASFNSLLACKMHQKEHSLEDGTYKCMKCNLTFHSKRNLWKHSFVHKRDVPVKTSSPILSNSHSFEPKSSGPQLISKALEKVRPYKCRFCDVRFTMKNNLQRHIRSQHSDKVINDSNDAIIVEPSAVPLHTYTCPICPNVYRSRTSLRRHQRKAHFFCKSCHHVYLTESSLKHHEQIYHPELAEEENQREKLANIQLRPLTVFYQKEIDAAKEESDDLKKSPDDSAAVDEPKSNFLSYFQLQPSQGGTKKKFRAKRRKFSLEQMYTDAKVSKVDPASSPTKAFLQDISPKDVNSLQVASLKDNNKFIHSSPKPCLLMYKKSNVNHTPKDDERPSKPAAPPATNSSSSTFRHRTLSRPIAPKPNFNGPVHVGTSGRSGGSMRQYAHTPAVAPIVNNHRVPGIGLANLNFSMGPPVLKPVPDTAMTIQMNSIQQHGGIPPPLRPPPNFIAPSPSHAIAASFVSYGPPTETSIVHTPHRAQQQHNFNVPMVPYTNHVVSHKSTMNHHQGLVMSTHEGASNEKKIVEHSEPFKEPCASLDMDNFLISGGEKEESSWIEDEEEASSQITSTAAIKDKGFINSNATTSLDAVLPPIDIDLL